MTQPMLRALTIVCATCLALACSSSPTSPDVPRSATWTANPPEEQRPIVIFVVSQGLFFDACVHPTPLPMLGDFQLILNGRTELGPGQVGFLNGRWWEDLNHNGIKDTSDRFFFCPIVGLGRITL
jgi:hypothetical protein